MSDEEDSPRRLQQPPSVSTEMLLWCSMAGGALAVINNIVATLALGVAQGPIVAFTTPLALALARLRYPQTLFPATLVFLPLIAVSMFTLNLGPPGVYKVVFLISPLVHDLWCAASRVGRCKGRIRIWKLLVAALLYPIGLLIGALFALRVFGITLPFMENPAIIAGFLGFFGIIGSAATLVAYRVHYRWLEPQQG